MADEELNPDEGKQDAAIQTVDMAFPSTQMTPTMGSGMQLDDQWEGFDKHFPSTDVYEPDLTFPDPPQVVPMFSGTAYVAGIKTTGLGSDPTKPYIKCSLLNGTAVQDAGPPSDPFPEDEEWYEKANTFGDIHLVRA